MSSQPSQPTKRPLFRNKAPSNPNQQPGAGNLNAPLLPLPPAPVQQSISASAVPSPTLASAGAVDRPIPLQSNLRTPIPYHSKSTSAVASISASAAPSTEEIATSRISLKGIPSGSSSVSSRFSAAPVLQRPSATTTFFSQQAAPEEASSSSASPSAAIPYHSGMSRGSASALSGVSSKYQAAPVLQRSIAPPTFLSQQSASALQKNSAAQPQAAIANALPVVPKFPAAALEERASSSKSDGTDSDEDASPAANEHDGGNVLASFGSREAANIRAISRAQLHGKGGKRNLVEMRFKKIGGDLGEHIIHVYSYARGELAPLPMPHGPKSTCSEGQLTKIAGKKLQVSGDRADDIDLSSSAVSKDSITSSNSGCSNCQKNVLNNLTDQGAVPFHAAVKYRGHKDAKKYIQALKHHDKRREDSEDESDADKAAQHTHVLLDGTDMGSEEQASYRAVPCKFTRKKISGKNRRILDVNDGPMANHIQRLNSAKQKLAGLHESDAEDEDAPLAASVVAKAEKPSASAQVQKPSAEKPSAPAASVVAKAEKLSASAQVQKPSAEKPSAPAASVVAKAEKPSASAQVQKPSAEKPSAPAASVAPKAEKPSASAQVQKPSAKKPSAPAASVVAKAEKLSTSAKRQQKEQIKQDC
jgi:hypothetical protein